MTMTRLPKIWPSVARASARVDAGQLAQQRGRAFALPRPRVSKSKTRATSGSWRVAGNVLIATISAPAPWSAAIELAEVGRVAVTRTLTAPSGAPRSGSCRSGRSRAPSGGLAAHCHTL